MPMRGYPQSRKRRHLLSGKALSFKAENISTSDYSKNKENGVKSCLNPS
jgi:hypothetical protein